MKIRPGFSYFYKGNISGGKCIADYLGWGWGEKFRDSKNTSQFYIKKLFIIATMKMYNKFICINFFFIEYVKIKSDKYAKIALTTYSRYYNINIIY